NTSVEGPTLGRLEPLLAAPDRLHAVAIGLEHAGAALAQGALVVHDQEAQGRPGAGIDGEEVYRVASGNRATAVRGRRGIETSRDGHPPSFSCRTDYRPRLSLLPRRRG